MTMRTTRKLNVIAAAVVLLMASATSVAHAADPLPSWNDTASKKAIIAFVEEVTKPGSPDFVPPAERIATFDNDGTLWCEQPMPVQFYFALDRVKALAPQHPEWKDKEPFASLLKGDLKTALAGGDHALLEPDATMLRHSEANNGRLLKVFPKGFALDATHRPHITMVQRYVRTADLDNVYAAVGKVLASASVNAMKLEAFKYYYIPSKEIGLAGIVAKPTPELLKLQQDVIAAVTPFTVQSGDSAAFVTTPEDPVIDPFLIDYVSLFVPKSSGEHFNPHVTTGVALREYLDKMLTEPFEPFIFSPAGAAVYQLGQFGTAAKKLKEWDLKP